MLRAVRVCHQCGAVTKPDDRFCASCGAALFQEGSSGTKDPLIGRTVGGAYVLQEIVGVGGMGRVYRAEQTTLGRTVAVKVIHPHLLHDEQTVARFYTEARASSRLNHPNSVSIIDFGSTDDGILYLVMEFLRGKDLAMVMHEEGPLPFDRICDVLTGVLDALGEAHALDIVHRDLKPENIILRPLRSGQDLVKVVDFGLATIISGDTSITRPGLVCGTPDYMSPEQGRGDPVDGRGDLYALGVVLYELLTDALPFDDETPTKVVLRHINDPVPNPAEAAPHRAIPETLTRITMKALAKTPGERFQTAAEMAQVLRDAKAELKADRIKTVECPACGAMNPATMRFCGSCGNRITGMHRISPTTPPRSRPKVSFYPPLGSKRPFVGRATELGKLEQLRKQASGSFVHVRLAGEPGVGKTRLLKEVAERCAEAGDLVVGAGPHPTGAPVPYGPIRTIAAALLEVEEGELAQLAADATRFSDPLTRAGLDELAKPQGLVGFDGYSRAGAVAEAIAVATRIALSRAAAERCVMVVDDLGECDGLSRRAIAELQRALASDSVLLITADAHATEGEGPLLGLTGLDPDEAGMFLLGKSSTPGAAGLGGKGRKMLPLYLEQILALGAGSAHDETLPPRLADAIGQRVERLEVRARRLLQSIAVFGGRCDIDELRLVADPQDLEGLDELVESNFVQLTKTIVEVAHPFIADLVEATIPAEARKEMHRRALEVNADREAPLEVRAYHTFRAGEPIQTLVMLERMGDVALRRGDTQAGVVAFHRALKVARREVLEKGDSVMDTAIITFSRKLGWAMARSGELAGADGVIREILDLTSANESARAQLYVALGRIAAMRDRRRDAMRHFGAALEIVAGVDPRVESELQLALARVRREEGELRGAANAYRRAMELYSNLTNHGVEEAVVQLELAETLVADGAKEDATTAARRARAVGRDAEAPAIEAGALGVLGRIWEMSGDVERARRDYEEAAQFAAAAGDAAGARRWTDAAALVG